MDAFYTGDRDFYRRRYIILLGAKQPWWAWQNNCKRFYCPIVSWVSWATAVAYTPEPMFEAFGLSAVFWIISA